jgi:hypothetical protein
MDAKPTSPPKTNGSTANLCDRATSTTIDSIEPNCESRSNNPSLKRPICLGAPE